MLEEYHVQEIQYSNHLMKKQLFEQGILRITQNNGLYSLYLKDRFVGLWWKNEHNRASDIINTAFFSYKSLTGEI